MAISYVGGATAVSQGNTDVSVSLTALTGGSDSAPSNGDLIIFAYNIADADNVDLNLACNTAGFAEIADLFGNGTQDANLGVFWKIHDGDTAVVGEGSLGGTDTSIQGAVMVFRGVDPTTPFDVTSTTATGTTTGDPDPPSIDWSTAGAWTVIVGSCAHAANVNGTFTGPTGYTTDFITVGNQDTADGIIGMGYNAAPADPENPGLITTGTTASGWCAVTMALRPQSITGSGTPDAQSSTLAGSGLSSSSSTDGAVAAQAATVAAAGLSTSLSTTGALAAQSSELDGTGTVESQAITGTGVLVAQAATLDGSGLSTALSTDGTIVAEAAALDAAGLSGSAGTGVLAAIGSTVMGVGLAIWVASGVLTAQAADLTSAGVTASIGTGALTDQAAVVTGTGSSGSMQTDGAILAQSALMAGSGLSTSLSTDGSWLAQAAQIVGVGEVDVEAIEGAGVLAAQSSVMDSAGLSTSFGSGTLLAQAATVSGLGVSLASASTTRITPRPARLRMMRSLRAHQNPFLDRGR